MKIYIIRHGETDANKEGFLQGCSNWPLNEDGIKLAKLTGENMKPLKFDACISSPLDRASKTAELVLKYSGNDIDIQYDDRLKEFNMGIYEGKRIKGDNIEIPLDVIEKFTKNVFLCDKFENGEDPLQLCQRTQAFLKELINLDYESVLLSTHGCALRAMLNMLYEDKQDFWQGHVPYNCSVSIVEANDGKMKLIENDKIYYDSKYIVDRYKF